MFDFRLHSRRLIRYVAEKESAAVADANEYILIRISINIRKVRVSREVLSGRRTKPQIALQKTSSRSGWQVLPADDTCQVSDLNASGTY